MLRDVLRGNEDALAWDESMRGSFNPNYFPPIILPVIPHQPWAKRSFPIPAGIRAQVIEEIKHCYSSGNVLIVSHKATIRIMLCSLLGIDVGRFRFRLGCPVGSVSIVEFSSHGPLLKALADRIHLDERLRNLPGT